MIAVEWPLTRAPVREGEPDDQEPPPHHRLGVLKTRVRRTIDAHGRRAWDMAVATVCTTLPTTSAPTASRAYHKMRELAASCALPRVHHSLHLCEAPGGFVQAVGDCMACDDWTWSAVSLESGAAPAVDVLPTTRGAFVRELSHGGDILKCAEEVVTRCGTPTQLVTADGAVEMNHDCLEEEHLALLYAQTDIALACLEKGTGTFVCKFFEGSDVRTRRWIAHVTTRFQSVSLIKPLSSRATNSERYLVARSFEGDASPLPRDGIVSANWIADTAKVLDRMRDDQARALDAAFVRIESTYSHKRV